MCGKLHYYAITFSMKFFFLQILLSNWTTGKTNSVQARIFPAPTELTVKSPIRFGEPLRKQMSNIFIYSWDSYSSETKLETYANRGVQ